MAKKTKKAVSKNTEVLGIPFKEGNKAAEKWTEEKIQELIDEMFAWFKEDEINNIFLKEFFVNEKDLYSSIVSYLSEKSPAFSKAIEKACDIQELRLSKNGLLNRYNPGITRLMLAAHHNIREDVKEPEKDTKEDIDITTIPADELAILAKWGRIK